MKLMKTAKAQRIFNFCNYKFSQIVRVPYKQLMNSEVSINVAISKAFGNDGLGLILISDVPGYKETRQNILKEGFSLLNLPLDYLKSLERPEADYQIGWASGNSYSSNVHEYMLSSYHCRVNCEKLKYPKDPELEDKWVNVWPDRLPNFRQYFQKHGVLCSEIQKQLLKRLDEYCTTNLPYFKQNSLYNVCKSSSNIIGKLILYSPPSNFEHKLYPKGKEDTWIEFHRDYGMLTALTHSIYFEKSGKVVDGIPSGLVVKKKDGTLVEVEFDENDILIQSGDTTFMLSGGEIVPAPHSAKITKRIPKNVYRITFANFLEPEFDFPMELPGNLSAKQIFEKDPYNMQNKMTTWKDQCEYMEFLLSAIHRQYNYNS